jgi:hypothetical protein
MQKAFVLMEMRRPYRSRGNMGAFGRNVRFGRMRRGKWGMGGGGGGGWGEGEG